MKLFEKLPVILDGPVGSEMAKFGYKTGNCFEKWILEHPEPVKELQKKYIEAGSEIIYTPTLCTNRILLQKYGLQERVRELNLRLSEISLEASGGKALVAGDMSTTGAAIEPYGDMEREKLVEIFSEQAKSLEEAGVDLYILETQLSGEEAKAAVSAIRLNSKKPIFVSFTCNESGKTFYGENFVSLLTEMQELGIAAFGINCCGDFELIKRLIKEMKQVANIPLIAKPNAGKPLISDGMPVYSLTPEEFSNQMTQIRSLGASLLGGCCGTNYNHISALSAVIK